MHKGAALDAIVIEATLLMLMRVQTTLEQHLASTTCRARAASSLRGRRSLLHYANGLVNDGAIKR